MSVTTVTLSGKGQLVIPKEIREELHWKPGIQLTLIADSSGVTLRPQPQKTGRHLADLIGLLQHEGPPVPIEKLCRAVDYRLDPDNQDTVS